MAWDCSYAAIHFSQFLYLLPCSWAVGHHLSVKQVCMTNNSPLPLLLTTASNMPQASKSKCGQYVWVWSGFKGSLVKIHIHYYPLVFAVIFFNSYCYSITVVCNFSPSLHPIPAKPTSLPHLYPPLDFVHVSFIVVPVIPSPHSPLAIPKVCAKPPKYGV